MRKIILLSTLVLFTISSLLAQAVQKKEIKKHPNFIHLDQVQSSQQAHQLFQEHLGATANDQMLSVSVQTDELGFTHEKFQQHYKGIPVDGATFTTHAKSGAITMMSGSFLDVKEISVQPSVSASSALAQAISHVGATKYLWEENGHSDHVDYSMPTGDLVIVADPEARTSARLAYKFDIYALEPISRAFVFIDAHTGQYIQEHHRIHEANVPATGNSLYNGNVSFTADNSSGPYRLRQTASGGGVETYDLNNGTNYGNASDITSSSTNFTGNNTGVQAHYGAEQTHSYFLNDHGRNSYNGSGGVLRSYISYSSNYVNAFWDGSRMTYGDGDGVNYGPLVSLDITGHEIAHGVTEFSANLVYQRESGALNESFSDIFGEMVEYHAEGSNDWQMGTDIGFSGSGAIRSMDNPNAFNDPDTYGGNNWINPNCGTPTRTNDYCGVHSNSGVQNKWFYILAVGESGTNDIGNSYSVSGIGRTKAAAIAYRNLTTYLSTNSTYADARAGAIQSAEDLYGAGSAEVIETTNAWYAVGVGGEYGTTSYCSSSGNSSAYEWIASVTVGDLTNTSGAAGYTNFTNLTANLSPGSNASVSLTPGFASTVYNEYWKIWIDYNADGDFSDAGELAFDGGSLSNTTVTGSISVPSGLTGTTRMRVSMKWDAAQTECETFSYGEVEDYTVDFGSGGGGGDAQAPSVPTGLSSSNITETSFSLSWNASNDNVGVTGYTVYLNGSSIGSVAGTSANITGVTASTTYAMTVAAYDAAGNISSQSSSLNVTTASAPDLQAPSVPLNLSSSNITETAFTLSWSASSDNVGVAGYTVYRDGFNIGNFSGTSANITGLTASTTYAMRVAAYDAAGNTSNQSSILNVTTSSGGGGGTPTQLSADYFESGWDGWIDGGSDCARVSSSYSWEGNYSIRIRDNSGTASSMTSSGYNLSSYNSVEVSFYFYAFSMENNEDFWLQFYNGSSWVTVAAYVSGSTFTGNGYYSSSVVIDNTGNTGFGTNSQFRFRCDASGNGDRIYIDEVVITADPATLMAGNSQFTIQKLSSPMQSLTGLESDLEEDILAYPNPARDLLTVEVHDPITSLKIYSLTGALVMEKTGMENAISLDVSKLASGTYIVHVTTEEEVLQQKFVKD